MQRSAFDLIVDGKPRRLRDRRRTGRLWRRWAREARRENRQIADSRVGMDWAANPEKYEDRSW